MSVSVVVGAFCARPWLALILIPVRACPNVMRCVCCAGMRMCEFAFLYFCFLLMCAMMVRVWCCHFASFQADGLAVSFDCGGVPSGEWQVVAVFGTCISSRVCECGASRMPCMHMSCVLFGLSVFSCSASLPASRSLPLSLLLMFRACLHGALGVKCLVAWVVLCPLFVCVIVPTDTLSPACRLIFRRHVVGY